MWREVARWDDSLRGRRTSGARQPCPTGSARSGQLTLKGGIVDLKRRSSQSRHYAATRAIAGVLVCTQVLTACASARSRPPSPVAPAQQTLRAGDILRVDVWRQPEYSGEFRVGPDGTLLHPLYQQIPVAGLTPNAAREKISSFLEGYLQAARLMVEPLYTVSIGGEVRSPDVYHVEGGTTVAESIGLAGGPTARAELNKVLLVRDGEQYDLSLGDEVSTFGSIPIVSGDQILVYPRSDFSLWRDVVAPVGTLASLVLVIIRIGQS